MAIRVGRPPASVRPSDWTAYMGRNTVSSALLLFGLVLFIQWLKRDRQLPDRRTTAGLLFGAFVVALSASVAPDFVTVLMAATLVVVALDSQEAIVTAIQRLQSMLGASPTGRRAGGGAVPV